MMILRTIFHNKEPFVEWKDTMCVKGTVNVMKEMLFLRYSKHQKPHLGPYKQITVCK